MEPRIFDLDLQLIADAGLMMISIFVLFLFASYFLFNPAREFLKKRQEKIKGELDSAAQDMEDAADVKREMVVIASMMAGKIVKASIDTNVQESLVNETLKEIGESTWLS